MWESTKSLMQLAQLLNAVFQNINAPKTPTFNTFLIVRDQELGAKELFLYSKSDFYIPYRCWFNRIYYQPHCTASANVAKHFVEGFLLKYLFSLQLAFLANLNICGCLPFLKTLTPQLENNICHPGIWKKRWSQWEKSWQRMWLSGDGTSLLMLATWGESFLHLKLPCERFKSRA